MAAPLGNSNAKGNPGGGRPSKKEMVWHLEKWEQDSLVAELEAKIASKVYSIRDVWLLKALKGSEPILKQAADKILATLIDHTTNGKDLPIPILNAIPSHDSHKENPDAT